MTGVLGGTFDPPHYGHLVLAEEARSRYSLDKVLMIPSRLPPHKSRVPVSPFFDRIEMLRLAVEGNPALEVADLESATGPSYTIDLLGRIRSMGLDPVFIIGTDSLAEMVSWKDYPLFLEMALFAAGRRAGRPEPVIPAEALGKVEIFEMPGMLVSSSGMRERFARSMPTRYLIPESVRSFVLKRGLYDCREGG